MPDIAFALLQQFWPWIAGLTTFGMASSYSVWGGTQSSSGTPGGILDTIFHSIVTAPAKVFGQLTGTLSTAHKATRSAASHWALANEKTMAAWFTHLNLVTKATFLSNRDTAVTAANSITTLAHRERADTTYRDGTRVKARATTALDTATTAIGRERALRSTVTTEHRAQVKRNVHYTHAIDVTLPRSIGRVRTREEKLSRDQAALRERTTSLENGALKTWEWMRGHAHSLATDAFAGAVAIALTSLGYGFLRCRGWKGLGGRITCGMGRLLEDLLFGLIDVLVIADLCQITRLMIDTAESSLVQGALGSFVAGIDDLLLCQGVGLPPALEGYWTALPPAQSFSALPAV